MKRFALLCVVGCFLLPSLSNAQEQEFPPIPSAPCVAHRGFSAVAPENTISAINKAIEIGAQGSEFDVYSSSDGILFLSHDSNLKRTTGLDLACASAPFSTLANLDFGYSAQFKDEYKGEKVATYDQALNVLKNSPTIPVIEVKASGFEEKIVAYVQKYDLVDKAIVIDFNAERLKKIRALEPRLCGAWLCSFKVEQETPDSMAKKIIDTCKSINTNVVDVQYQAVSPKFLRLLNEAGITVMCWTVDNPQAIESLVKMGVPSITTNRPDLVLEIQKKYQNK